MHAWTSGSRSSSAVPVVRVKSVGARTEGDGDGRDVRWGFCDKAVSNGARLAGGVINVMSRFICLVYSYLTVTRNGKKLTCNTHAVTPIQ